MNVLLNFQWKAVELEMRDFIYTTASIKLESWKAILFILENKNYRKMSEHMSS